MPKLTVWLVRASMLHMGAGFLFGSLLLHHKGVPIYDWTWNLRDPHIEMMIFGWTMQFVMGVAFWVLPRLSGARKFGSVRLAWCSFVLVNAGIVWTALGAWLDHSTLALTGRALTLGALVLFAIVLYPRIKPLGGAVANSRSLESNVQVTGDLS